MAKLLSADFADFIDGWREPLLLRNEKACQNPVVASTRTFYDNRMAYTDHHLYFDDVEVGQEWTSGGRTITETDIVNFAGLSGDFNPIHIDHEFAKTTPFRRPIAHGLLGVAVSSGLGLNSPPMRTLAFVSLKEWYFRYPIVVGDTVRIRSKVLEKEPRARGRRGVITWQRQLINQEGKVVQEGVSQTLVEGRGAKKEPAAK